MDRAGGESKAGVGDGWLQSALLDAVPDPLVVLDAEHRVVSVNRVFCEWTGFRVSELLGADWVSALADGEGQAEARWREIEQAGGAEFDATVRCADGRRLDVVVGVRAAHNSGGERVGYVATYRNLEGLRFEVRLERALREVALASAPADEDLHALASLVAAHVTALLDTAFSGVMRFDADRTTIVGHAGRFPFPPALAPDDAATVSAMVAATGRAARIDDYAALDGQFAAYATAHGMRGAVAVPIRIHGELWGCLGAMTPRPGGFTPGTEALLDRFATLVSTALAVTEARAQLRQSEARYRTEADRRAAVFNAAYDAIFTMAADGTAVEVNDAACAMFGVRREQIIGRDLHELLTPPQNRDQARAGLRHMQRTGRSGVAGRVRDEVGYRADGTQFPIEISVSGVRGSEPAVFVGVVRDITERKAAERELERLAQAAEHSTDAVISYDLDGRICRWSAGAEAVLGFGAQEVMGLSVPELNALAGEPEDVERRSSEVVGRVIAGETLRYDARRRQKDGTTIDLQTTLIPWREDGRTVGFTSTTVDITERKRAERAREQALAALQEAQRLARLGSWTWDPQCDEATWSEQMYALFGRDPTLGPAVGEAFFAYVHHKDRERLATGYAEMFGGGAGFELNYRIVAGDGTERTLQVFGHADPEHPGCYLGTVQDVSAQRRGEQAQAANQAKSDFLSRMSHELRTPLNAISGFGQLLAMDDLEPDQAENINYVLKAANHMLALVNDVLDFSRVEAGQLKVSPEAVALLDLVRDAVELMEPLAEAGEMKLALDASGLAKGEHVHADAQRFKQVLLNLLSNAIKYNRPGGHVDITFETLESGRVRTSVADTGIGIRPEHMAHLFEPFERLGAEQSTVEGTGLGLALSKRLIETMGGTIDARSTHGVGSVFAIELDGIAPPQTEHAEASEQPGSEPLGETPRSLRILYIDDNVSNVKLVQRILDRHQKVELIPAMQGSIGLELAHQHHPALILLDLHLPDIQGEEVLKRLKADPETTDIPVIVLTGDATPGLAERLARLGTSDLLLKPFDVRRFLQVIAAHIDEL